MKGLRITGKILLNILVILIVAALLLHLGVTAIYFDYFLHSKGEFVVPGLDAAFVHQGFDYIGEEDTYLISGYMSDDTAARVYVRRGDGYTYYVNLLRPDGTAYVEHAGGVCHNGDFLYVDKFLEKYNFPELDQEEIENLYRLITSTEIEL